jgi:RNA polymerase sigma factor (sigma-70 family)
MVDTDGPDPHLDAARWDELIEAAGVDSLLVVIQNWMSERLLAQWTVEDVWQETLLHAWRDRAAYQWHGRKAFRTWLLSIARNRIHDAVDHLQARKRGGGLQVEPLASTWGSSSSGASGLPCTSMTPARLAYHRERARLMDQALRSLDPELEAVVRGYLFEQENMTALAHRLGIALSTARYRFRKGSAAYATKLAQLLSISGLRAPPSAGRPADP